MKRAVLLSLLLSLAVAPAVHTQTPAKLTGFTAQGSEAERALEAKFPRRSQARQRARGTCGRSRAKPHHAGSPASREVAEYILSRSSSRGGSTRRSSRSRR